MKRITTVFITATAFFLYACDNNKESSTSNETITTQMSTDTGTGMMDDHTDQTKNAPDMSTSNDMNLNFATDAVSGSTMEVELAKLARQNAMSREVKAFAKMIEEDHIKASAQLKSIVSSKNMIFPSELMSNHKKHLDDMLNKKGKEFDKEYIDMMVEDHNEDIRRFKEASATLTDEQLKDFATKTLPVLQKHLDKAKALQANMASM